MPSLRREVPSRSIARASRPALVATFALTLGVLGGDAAAQPGAAGSGVTAVAEIRVERASFWYDCPAATAEGDPADSVPVAACVLRIVDALEAVVREYPERFPQPPPLATVIRAVPRERLGTSALWSSALGSYGCARLLDGVVVIEIGPSTFVGRDALNDAELRSFLAHELVHAYQFARGSHAGREGELARRELEALDWELEHVAPEVRTSYRADLEFNRKMYAAMLAE